MQNAHASPSRQKAEKEQLGNGPALSQDNVKTPYSYLTFIQLPTTLLSAPGIRPKYHTPAKTGRKKTKVTIVA